MPRQLAYLQWLSNGNKPTPPAATAALAKPKEVIVLANAFMKAYSAPRRIA